MEDIPTAVLKASGFPEYFFHQKRVIDFFLENPYSNFILKAPTGSGKTLMAANLIEKRLREGGKGDLCSPLKETGQGES